MDKWNKEQLIDWINNSSELNSSEKEKVIKGINNSQWKVDQYASCKDRADLQDTLSIASDIGVKLWKYINEYRSRKQEENANNAKNVYQRTSNLGNGNNNKINNNNYKFKPMVFVNNKLVKLQSEVTSATTIYELKKIIYEEELGTINETDPDNIRQIEDKISKMSLGDFGDNNKTLGDYQIVAEKTVTVISRVIGGAQQELKNKNKYNRELNIFHPLISKIKTHEQDSITYDDIDNEWRAKLPCGHVLSSISMFMYIEHLFDQVLTNNRKLIKFFCPVPSCKQEIEWTLMAIISDLNDSELIYYTNIVEKHRREQNGIKNCPHCQILIEKPQKLSQNRVHCIACNGSDFCWSCLQKWQGGGFQICGSANCATYCIVNELQNCPLKKPTYIDVQMPSTRACPNCLHLIRHDNEDNRCKHVTCPNDLCKKAFCFVCLGVQDTNGEWACFDHKYACQVAPRQQLK